jgi:hypothetical protein
MQNKSVLIQLLKRYVNHKVILSRNTSYYNENCLVKSLNTCQALMLNYCNEYSRLTEKQIANLILGHKQQLFDILPSDHNKSFNSSLANYNNLITLAQSL